MLSPFKIKYMISHSLSVSVEVGGSNVMETGFAPKRV
jgi:hypothetical protein